MINKKLNTFLFVAGATVVNILIMILLYLIPFFAVGLIMKPFLEGNAGLQQVFMVLISIVFPLFAIIGSFFVYNRVVKIFTSKIDMEKYFHPINMPGFRSKNQGPR
jgi:hypothetical protein